MTGMHRCPTLTVGGEGLTSEGASRVRSAAAAGGVIVFPTDTFYGLGADPFSPEGIEKVYALKGRPPERTLLVLVDGVARIERFAAGLTEPHLALVGRYWPGPLTLLFPARAGLRPEIVSAGGEVALRLPGTPLCRAVVSAAGGALTGTSANRSGDAPPRSAAEALNSLGKAADLVVDGGTLPPSRVSTLLSLAGGRLRILREGAVGRDELERFFAERGW